MANSGLRKDISPPCDQVDVQPDTTVTIQETGTTKLTGRVFSCYYVPPQWIPARLSWTSDDTTIATVVEGGNSLSGFYGLVTGKSIGTVFIRGTDGQGSDGDPVRVTTNLRVGVSGPSTLMRYQSGQYVASPAGGNGSVTYQWRTRYGWNSVMGSWSPPYSTGTQNYTYASVSGCAINSMDVDVIVTDSLGSTAEQFAHTGITNPC